MAVAVVVAGLAMSCSTVAEREATPDHDVGSVRLALTLAGRDHDQLRGLADPGSSRPATCDPTLGCAAP